MHSSALVLCYRRDRSSSASIRSSLPLLAGRQFPRNHQTQSASDEFSSRQMETELDLQNILVPLTCQFLSLYC